MNTFNGLTAAEFYFRRDARTITIVGNGLALSRLIISVDDAEAETFSGQLAFLLLVNLNTRWCRDIQFKVPDVAVHPDLKVFFGCSNLHEATSRLASAIDPFGSFDIAKFELGKSHERVHIHVGIQVARGAYPLMGRGWMAGCGECILTNPLIGEQCNPLGAALAASIGTAWAMRQCIGDTEVFADVMLSLWNYDDGAAATDGPALANSSLGRLLMVGIGAVGSSMAYLLPLLRQKPSGVCLVDADDVDYPNLNRAPAFLAEDVGVKKVQVVARHLERSGITTKFVPEWFDGIVVSVADFDLVVPAANEPAAREAIMNSVPPLMISASTGTQWDAYRQRHIPIKDDCLVCRFPSKNPAPALGCATGKVVIHDVPGITESEQTLSLIHI